MPVPIQKRDYHPLVNVNTVFRSLRVDEWGDCLSCHYNCLTFYLIFHDITLQTDVGVKVDQYIVK